VAEAPHLVGERRSGVRREKGAIVGLYADPPPGGTVVCVDELGPVAAKAYPGPSWADDRHRPHFKPDYSRHGYVWAYGALAHRTGEACIETADARNTATWLHFLDRLESFVPEGEVYLIVDALPLNWTLDTMLWTWGHPRFRFVPLPKAAAWLNLIEGFWKILTERSLHGRTFCGTDQLTAALQAGVADWNEHPTPFLWGRPPKPKRHFKRTYLYRI
jgi:transposase